MRNQYGIWLDHREAIIIGLTDEKHTIEWIESDVESRHRATGGTRGRRAFVHRSINSGAKNDTRRRAEWQHHYQEVLSRIPRKSAVFVLGPGQARAEFLTFLESYGSDFDVIGACATPRMTTPELVARVKEAFGAEPRREAVAAAELARQLHPTRASAQ